MSNFDSWDYAIKISYYECCDAVTTEELYQAFKERLLRELCEQVQKPQDQS